MDSRDETRAQHLREEIVRVKAILVSENEVMKMLDNSGKHGAAQIVRDNIVLVERRLNKLSQP